ncbi:DUF4198 domain-containing protein [Mucilaginibacter myungsuensis]|uniref:DUF4198 domain-containing protein n=1 Tax=Mucilaginibacter myungsuensis TaxID=649104 RepID=A0A929PXG3_9SPHI|nr:DUF4198 domain-containing protein [Mucilaginibacter myungsuensis]MBE9663828.1 DUF4198 domain-containing protein [Mucilaginibacter myungsuensis]MDN3598457.1 DUF4198 domain-containing protein [Mucilaginibacter myungsuensis]
MKFKVLLPFFALFLVAVSAKAQDTYLAAQKYFVHKGDKLDIYLLSGDQFKDIDEFKYDSTATEKFNWYIGGKKTDLKPAAKDSASPVFVNPMNTIGLSLIEMVRRGPVNSVEREDYSKRLAEDGMIKLAETVGNSNQSTFKEKKTTFLKTMIMVDKPTGNDFEKQLGHEFEITLKKNPYKMNYGDEIVGTLLFKGKPQRAANVDVYVKVPSGNVYVDHVSTNEKGEFAVITSREGVYMLRSAMTEPSTTTDADFSTVQTAFTFLFNSKNDDTMDWVRKK